jgi:hypothetical protein
MSFDIVISVGPNDHSHLDIQLEYTVKNIIGYRNIYIVHYDPSIVNDNIRSAFYIVPEYIFPITKTELISEYHIPKIRAGWVLQQIIKLYSGFVIPNILDRYLVIDADTFFLRPTEFVDSQNRSLYNYGTEYHPTYFNHMNRLHPSLEKMNASMSGICHHMIFDIEILKSLFTLIENYHNKPFYKAFLDCIEFPNENDLSVCSEYEIYFNFILKYYHDIIQIRPLGWQNSFTLQGHSPELNYVSIHIRK